MFFFDEIDDESEVDLNQSDDNVTDSDVEQVSESDDDLISKETDSDEPDYIKKIEELEDEVKNLKDLNLRMRAEFDNFKKRTNREKQGLYSSAQADCVEEFLPLLDGLERGFDSFDEKASKSVVEGFQMLINICADILKKLGVESVGKKGEPFDPRFHNAVKTVEIDSSEKNIVYEVLLKGYCKGDNVVRHAMVVVANP